VRDLGVASIGHRRRLLDAIAALGAGQLAERRPPSQTHHAAGEAEWRQPTVMNPEDLLNLTIARALCLTVPPTLLAIADEVVE
jgi:hypothetical protein